MSCGQKHIRDGINQLERLSKMLLPDYVKIDERSQSDLLKFLSGLRTELAFYGPDFQPNGNWEKILEEITSYPLPSSLEISEYPQSVEPHLALYIAFARLFLYAQNELNQLTRKHLNFYYQDVLAITLKESTPDTVNLILELSKTKGLSYFKLDAHTEIDGGQGPDGNALVYRTNQEIIVNRAELIEQKTLFVDQKSKKSIIFVAPIANSKDGQGTPFSGDNAFWAPFGEPQVELPIESQTMVEANIGFAISSPILILQEGTRKIDLIFNFSPIENYAPGSALQNSFDISCTTTKGWFKPKVATSTLKEEASRWLLYVHIELGVDQPPLSFFDPVVHEENYSTQWPVVRLLLKPDALDYDTVKPLQLDFVEISVEVEGMKKLIVQNEQGVLEVNKPFYPFGTQPTINSNFYIGSSEVFQKKLNHLALDILWDEIPEEEFSSYYSGYGVPPSFSNNSFVSSISLLLNKSWTIPLQASATLFNAINANFLRQIEMGETDFSLATANQTYQRKPTTETLTEFKLEQERGFIRLQLTSPTTPFQAFGHKKFPSLYTTQTIALAKHDPTSGNPEPILPNPPYTPKIKSLSLNYKSSEIIHFDANNTYDTLFRIGPFGHSVMNADNGPELIPQYNDQGELLLGLANFSPPQTINFLFHLEEGSSDTEVVLEEDNIEWSYLSDNQWKSFSPEEILINNTQSFKTSGIISLSVPKDATLENSILPYGMLWLKAGVGEGATGASKIREIFTNAVQATLELDRENITKFDKHLSGPLPAKTIKKLSKPTFEIKKVTQPLPSFGGRPTEQSDSFYTRVSERLRHKQRAIQIWDFERIVLEAFPNIFKAKCLTHSNGGNFLAAGDVTMLIISNLRNKNVANPFTPRTSKVVLEEIQTYLKNFVSPFVNIITENPVYESILVEAKIGFREGFDPGYYSSLLNEEIKQFLSPWAFVNGKDIVIGGRIYKSSILQYIESREYVDFVVDFKLYHIHDGPRPGGISEMAIDLDFIIAETIKPNISDMVIDLDFIVGKDVDIACATTPRSVLVTYPNHRIVALRPNEHHCPGASVLGIGFMTVNIDFVIGK